MSEPSWLAVLVPGRGATSEHDQPVIDALVGAGAVVVRSNWGDAAVIPDFEPVVDDLAGLVDRATSQRPGLPLVLLGHAVGAMIVVRYAQRYADRAVALVLAAPVLGPWQALDLLSEKEIPDSPYGSWDRATLSAIEECLATIDFDHPLGDDLPALWLHGIDDSLVPMADTRAGLDRVRGLRFEERLYPSTRHDLLPDPAVLADITAFVSRVVRPVGSIGG